MYNREDFYFDHEDSHFVKNYNDESTVEIDWEDYEDTNDSYDQSYNYFCD